jgi:hypothetical protein
MFAIELLRNKIVMSKIENNDWLIDKIILMCNEKKYNLNIKRELWTGIFTMEIDIERYSQQQIGNIIYNILNIERGKR